MYELTRYAKGADGALGPVAERTRTGSLATARSYAAALASEGYGVRVRGVSGCGIDETHRPCGTVSRVVPNYWRAG